MKPGDVYTAWDMHAQHWITWVFLRPCTDADVEHMDTWGYPAKNPFGQYWHFLDLENGRVSITIDNVVDNPAWELL